jgi:two-component system chemotaxis response regulator CheB
LVAKKIRVLVVDDSAFMRRVISQMVEASSDFEVIGTARDGREGVDMAMALKPDVITMDIEMPKMNGLEATELIMSTHPIPIMVLSSLTTEGAKATFDALDKGAVDYIDKNLDRSALDIVKIQEQLQEKIRAVSKKRVRLIRPHLIVKPRVALPPADKGPGRRGFATQKIAFVAIGASTGGPRAVQEVLSNLPRGLSTSFVISVHMPGAFTGTFAERLNAISELSVKEAENGEKVEDGKALVCPGGRQTRVMRKGITDFHMRINQEPSDAIYKPSVDITMSSVAEAYPGRSLGVILTGMGADGAKGMKQIKDRGGKTLVQDEESCVVYGMPKAVIDAGTADKVVSLELIAGEIVNMI